MTPVTNHYRDVILHTDNLPLPLQTAFESNTGDLPDFAASRAP